MKKGIASVLALVLIFSLCACGSKQSAPGSASVEEWTRVGSFDNADGDFLSISFSDTEGYEGSHLHARR